jgi:hypothetical protein
MYWNEQLNCLSILVLCLMDCDSSAGFVSSLHSRWDGTQPTYLPLGSVCFDHLGVHLMTVEAHEGGKCSSNINRYQYLGQS